jgi:hypothetical protein
LDRQHEDTTPRRAELERRLALEQERLARAYLAGYNAEHKLRSLLPATRSAQHALSMWRTWLTFQHFHMDQIRELEDWLTDLDLLDYSQE